jgi:hypothetical protein
MMRKPGGPVPLGYAAMDKKIVVVSAEAEAVRPNCNSTRIAPPSRFPTDTANHNRIARRC